MAGKNSCVNPTIIMMNLPTDRLSVFLKKEK